MECLKAQEEILEALENEWLENDRPEEVRRAIDAHLADCPACAEFAAKHKTLDARLNAMLIPPEMSPAFRTALRRRIGREPIRLWPDSLPHKVHFLSCGVATLLCAVLLPFDGASILGAGAMTTVLTYALLTAIRSSFEDADEPG